MEQTTFYPAVNSIINTGRLPDPIRNGFLILRQDIYHTGQLGKVDYIEGIAKQVNYQYHAADGKVHDLGTFDLEWATKWKRRTGKEALNRPASGVEDVDYVKRKNDKGKDIFFIKEGDVNTPLLTLFKNSKEFTYQKNDKRTIILSETTDREYFNPERLAAIIGAVLGTGFEDVVTNGSVKIDGTGAPSVSHVNGNNIDFKYLRVDGKRPKIDITGGVVHTDATGSNKLGIERQEKLLDAFNKFGFGETRKNLSWFLPNGKTLKHCIEDAKINEKSKSSHYHHLHLTGFKAKYR